MYMRGLWLFGLLRECGFCRSAQTQDGIVEIWRRHEHQTAAWRACWQG